MERYSLYVTTFGDFSITVTDTQAENTGTVRFNSRSKKLLPLIQYLILNRERPIPVSKLYEVFWPGEPADAAANALKILMHRARIELNKLDVYTGKELIKNHQGSYQWNNDIPMEVDCEIFDRKYLESIRKTGEDQLSAVMEATSLYKDRFLPAALSYRWAVSLHEHFHIRYIEMCINGASVLETLKRYDELVEFLEPAIKLGNRVETLHIQYIRALFQTGQKEKAHEQYRKTSEHFYIHRGGAPTEQFISLYKEISAYIRDYEEDVNVVLAALPKLPAVPGAMVCNLSVLRDVSYFALRGSLVFGYESQLALITVSDSNGNQPTNKVMDTVTKLLAENLRTSDAYTQYSMRQYLVLMPNTSPEEGLELIQNVERKIKTGLRTRDVVLLHSLTPLNASTVESYKQKNQTA